MKWIIFIIFPIVTFICHNPKQNVSGSFVVKKDTFCFGYISWSVASAGINPALRKALGNSIRNSGGEIIQVQTKKNAEIILNQRRIEEGKMPYPYYNVKRASRQVAMMYTPAFFAEVGKNQNFFTKL